MATSATPFPLKDVTLISAPSGWTGSSRLVGSLFHDHPAKLPQKSVDVRCPPFPCSAIRFNRDGLPTSFAASSVKDHPNIGVTAKTLFHRLVRCRNPTSNDD
jgi:hypothetical protein